MPALPRVASEPAQPRRLDLATLQLAADHYEQADALLRDVEAPKTETERAIEQIDENDERWSELVSELDNAQRWTEVTSKAFYRAESSLITAIMAFDPNIGIYELKDADNFWNPARGVRLGSKVYLLKPAEGSVPDPGHTQPPISRVMELVVVDFNNLHNL